MDPAQHTNNQIPSDNKMPPKKTPVAGETADNGADVGTSQQLTINGKVPSQSDIKFFLTILENMTTKPVCNWENVAQAMGHKDTKCTKERWRQVMKRYELEYPEGPAPPAAKGARGKKATATTEDAEGAEGAAVPSATKAKTPRGKKVAAAKSAEKAVSDDELGVEGVTPGDDKNVGTPTTPATPIPAKGRGRPGSSTKKRASPEREDGDEAEEGTPAKKKPTPRKPRGPNKKTLAAQAAAAALANATPADANATPADANADADADGTENSGLSVNTEPSTPDNAGPPASDNAGQSATANDDAEMKETETTDDAEAKEASESPLSSVHSSIFGDGSSIFGPYN